MPTATTLRCPKCDSDMATYERSGITVEQCRECRGLFLDRGELERLIDAEGGAWIGPKPGVPAGAAHAAPAAVPPSGDRSVRGLWPVPVPTRAHASARGYRSEWE
jgi:Zn-finger nucleic acid-binding protein